MRKALVALVCVASVLLASCSKPESKTDAKPAPAPAAPAAAKAEGAAVPAATGKTTVNIVTKGIKLNIDSMKAKAGETIHFIYDNQDDEKHNMVIVDATTISPDVTSGQKGEFDLTMPSKAGQYQVVCAYHPVMEFKLIVE